MKNKRELLVFTCIMVVALLGLGAVKLWTSDPGSKVIITVNGTEVGVYSLLNDRTICVENEYGINKLEIKDAKVHMLEADCPDKICVQHAPIGNANEVIICLPHKLVIEIVSENNQEIDAIAE